MTSAGCVCLSRPCRESQSGDIWFLGPHISCHHLEAGAQRAVPWGTGTPIIVCVQPSFFPGQMRAGTASLPGSCCQGTKKGHRSPMGAHKSSEMPRLILASAWCQRTQAGGATGLPLGHFVVPSFLPKELLHTGKFRQMWEVSWSILSSPPHPVFPAPEILMSRCGRDMGSSISLRAAPSQHHIWPPICLWLLRAVLSRRLCAWPQQ